MPPRIARPVTPPTADDDILGPKPSLNVKGQRRSGDEPRPDQFDAKDQLENNVFDHDQLRYIHTVNTSRNDYILRSHLKQHTSALRQHGRTVDPSGTPIDGDNNLSDCRDEDTLRLQIQLLASPMSVDAGDIMCALQSYATPSPVARPAGDTRDASDKVVVAHFMVGNSNPYTVADWTNDITLASSKGIDGFALNVGSDSWQPTQVANAYAAAKSFGTNFKLFVSLDMSSLPCTAAGDTATVQNYITTYSSHPNQLLYDSKMVLSTFAGESCTFGQGSLNDAWTTAVKASSLPAVYFIPSFFVDPATFSGLTVMDGAFNWNGGWPMTDADVSFDTDTNYINNLGGRSYIAPVSPWFFTHYGPDTYNKNWIYRSDDWLLAERWELLINNRDSIPFVEIITWNDYGESHYVGPIEGDQPNSQAWVDGFDHQGWLDLIAYYITAYKTGSYPAITTDRTFLWSRLYPEAATAPDSIGPPTDAAWESDTLWAVTLLTSPATVTLACGSSTNSTLIPAGLTKLSLPLSTDCSVTSTISRDGSSPVTFAPEGFTFSTSPPSYNFNAFVAASPA